ncbi:hypothetical protein JTB14_001444 [Gonioctena quinquepunctata]|nr:hypothetical protein JTB14_001444 [Gonioctena quinquepunctata]
MKGSRKPWARRHMRVELDKKKLEEALRIDLNGRGRTYMNAVTQVLDLTLADKLRIGETRKLKSNEENVIECEKD